MEIGSNRDLDLSTNNRSVDQFPFATCLTRQFSNLVRSILMMTIYAFSGINSGIVWGILIVFCTFIYVPIYQSK